MQTIITAKRLLEAGRVEEAGHICQSILAIKADDRDALFLQALICHRQGKNQQALKHLKRLLDRVPDHATAWFNYGFISLDSGLLYEAEQGFRAVIRLCPAFADAYFNLGNVYLTAGEFSHAATCFQQAVQLRPNYRDAWNNLGAAWKGMRRYADSIAALQKAIAISPTPPSTWYNLGLSLQLANNFPDAIKAYRKAIEQGYAPDNLLYNLGICCNETGDLDAAINSYRKAIDLSPEDPRIYNNLGLALEENQNFDAAIEVLRKAIALQPDFHDAYCNLGNVLQRMEHFDEAQECYAKAISLAPDFAKAHYNMGNCHQQLNRHREAVDSYTRTVQIDPQMAEAHWNRATSLLLLGHFKEGFAEYQWRWKRKSAPKIRPPKPLWDGHPIPEATLLVHSEQGIGDSLMFLRYLPMVRERVGRLLFTCEEALLELVEPLGWADAVVDKKYWANIEETYHYYIPLLDLPHLFETSAATIPAPDPYLFADAAKTEALAEHFTSAGDTHKIGIVYSGNPAHSNDKNRSCGLTPFLPLLRLENITWYSLQKEPDPRETDHPIISLAPHLHTFADTAACIAHLDLVITVDTSVAHLAGAMGCPTWVLLPFVPDWRWQLNRQDTPWYSGMRLFRQPRRHDWEAVFHEICQALENVEKSPRYQTKPAAKPHRPPATPGLTPRTDQRCYFGLTEGENFGWGVCSKYLIRHLTERLDLHQLNPFDGSATNPHLPGPLFKAISGVELFSLYDQAWGERTIGYTFFENELPPVARENARRYDLILAGSSWCRDRLLEAGIRNTDVLIQGIDPEIFFPITEQPPEDAFIIFSGGKFELRKGQDIVLKAFALLQDKYPDIILMNSWYNIWPNTMRNMASSPYIQYSHQPEGDWQHIMERLYRDNEINPERVRTLPLMPNTEQRKLYAQTHLGVFPNRCEGGTNLVLMEYMACGKPVIASNVTGHTDILTEENSLLLEEKQNFLYRDPQGNLLGKWYDSSPEEVAERIEYAYHHREQTRRLGLQAGKDLKRFTWAASANRLLHHLEKAMS